MIIKVKTLVFCENFEYGDVHVMLVFSPHCGDNAKVKHCSFPRLSHSLPRGWAVVTNDLVHHAETAVQEKHAL